uniref:VWFC domain-containing protein n=1 Tax=Anopheles gambiae TaxID=7165 RepID=A0A1S4H604_ANOGA
MHFLTVFTLTLCGALTVARGCDVPLAHYKTMHCQPVGNRPDGCPERYDCPSITAHESSKCYFNGKTYDIDQPVPDAEVSQFCSAACYCRSANPIAKFRCVHVDCAEFFKRFDYDNCVRQYSPQSCCSTGTVCGEERKKLATCELESEIYREGQRMRFKGNQCRTCICTAGFNATAIEQDPNCVETVCGFELFEEKQVYGGGIPVYKPDGCCPWEWRMPKQTDTVVKGAVSKPATDPKLQCKYGSLTLDVGDSLDIQQRAEGQKLSCSCQVPPLMHCMLN